MLKELSERATILTSISISLTAVSEAETDRLARIDEASRLKESLQKIRNQLEELKRSERAVENAHTKVQITESLVGIGFTAVKVLAAGNRSKRIKSVGFPLNSNSKAPTFGKLVVLLGPSGLPQDVKAVSISKLARDSNKTESEIIAELRNEGCLLLNEEGFNSVIERLISGIQDGSIRSSIFGETDSQANELKDNKSISYLPK